MSANRDLDQPVFGEALRWQVVHQDPTISERVYSAPDPVSAAMKAMRDNKAMEYVTVRQIGAQDNEHYSFGKFDLPIGKKSNVAHQHNRHEK
jgi:hypothetical protein